MNNDLWDYADLKALDIVCREYFGHSRFVALQKTLEYCAFNGWECEDESHRAQLASAIRYGAEMAERDLLRNARYYSSGIDCIEEWGSLDDARKDRELAVHLARVEAQRRGEWPDWVEPIEYGYLVPVAKATMVPVGDEDSCDYRLEPVR